jgi:ribonuclease HI
MLFYSFSMVVNDMVTIIYTDGACSGNPGPGGWGAVIIDPNKNERHISGTVVERTTNQQMELKAAIEALKYIKPKSEVVVYTDSTYVVTGMNDFMTGWLIRGWRNSQLRLIENKILWQSLLKATARHTSVEWRHVRGHNGDTYQEKANELAQSAARAGKEVFATK